MSNKYLIILAGILIFIGVTKPDLPSIIPAASNDSVCVIDAPSDDVLLENSRAIVKIMKSSDDSTKKNDCIKLSSLYCDMSILIELDQEDEVIKDTGSIRQANILSGKMLRLNIKDKYPGLADAAKTLIGDAIGYDDVALDDNLRAKSVEAFRALSWAFYEGSK